MATQSRQSRISIWPRIMFTGTTVVLIEFRFKIVTPIFPQDRDAEPLRAQIVGGRARPAENPQMCKAAVLGQDLKDLFVDPHPLFSSMGSRLLR